MTKKDLEQLILQWRNQNRFVSDIQLIELSMSQWFLKPQQNKNMKRGKSNEPLIMDKLPEFLRRNSPIVLRSNLTKTPGLVAKCHQEWFATSIDGFVVLEEPFRNLHMS